jgi:hypothetical protein
MSITKRSVNGIKEYRNYLWMTDKDGKIINKPEGGNDHFWMLSATVVETTNVRSNTPIHKPNAMLQRKHRYAQA